LLNKSRLGQETTEDHVTTMESILTIIGRSS